MVRCAETRRDYKKRLSKRAKQAKKAKTNEEDPCQYINTEYGRIPIPNITEDDLLAFQRSHFGDDTKPDVWFVGAETALNYAPELDPELQDDGLGWYEDGTKRTLTDEQIEMFRHTEMQLLMRDGAMTRGQLVEAGYIEDTVAEEKNGEATLEEVEIRKETGEDQKPTSTASTGQNRDSEPPAMARQEAAREEVHRTAAKKQKTPKGDIPYKERHKRNWEGYIEDRDPTHGSRTHRRIVRELDEQQASDVELDY